MFLHKILQRLVICLSFYNKGEVHFTPSSPLGKLNSCMAVVIINNKCDLQKKLFSHSRRSELIGDCGSYYQKGFTEPQYMFAKLLIRVSNFYFDLN